MTPSRIRIWGGMLAAGAVALLFWARPVQLMIDWHEERCLPDVRAAILLKRTPQSVADGDYLFWKPSGSLSYLKEDVVFKRVAGVPGDHLVIKSGQVSVNGRVVVSGFPLGKLYGKSEPQFQRDVVIPPGHYFMIGTHPLSDDSRYWGYLPAAEVLGKGYPIF